MEPATTITAPSNSGPQSRTPWRHCLEDGCDFTTSFAALDTFDDHLRERHNAPPLRCPYLKPLNAGDPDGGERRCEHTEMYKKDLNYHVQRVHNTRIKSIGEMQPAEYPDAPWVMAPKPQAQIVSGADQADLAAPLSDSDIQDVETKALRDVTIYECPKGACIFRTIYGWSRVEDHMRTDHNESPLRCPYLPPRNGESSNGTDGCKHEEKTMSELCHHVQMVHNTELKSIAVLRLAEDPSAPRLLIPISNSSSRAQTPPSTTNGSNQADSSGSSHSPAPHQLPRPAEAVPAAVPAKLRSDSGRQQRSPEGSANARRQSRITENSRPVVNTPTGNMVKPYPCLTLVPPMVPKLESNDRTMGSAPQASADQRPRLSAIPNRSIVPVQQPRPSVQCNGAAMVSVPHPYGGQPVGPYVVLGPWNLPIPQHLMALRPMVPAQSHGMTSGYAAHTPSDQHPHMSAHNVPRSMRQRNAIMSSRSIAPIPMRRRGAMTVGGPRVSTDQHPQSMARPSGPSYEPSTSTVPRAFFQAASALQVDLDVPVSAPTQTYLFTSAPGAGERPSAAAPTLAPSSTMFTRVNTNARISDLQSRDGAIPSPQPARSRPIPRCQRAHCMQCSPSSPTLTDGSRTDSMRSTSGAPPPLPPLPRHSANQPGASMVVAQSQGTPTASAPRARQVHEQSASSATLPDSRATSMAPRSSAAAYPHDAPAAAGRAHNLSFLLNGGSIMASQAVPGASGRSASSSASSSASASGGRYSWHVHVHGDEPAHANGGEHENADEASSTQDARSKSPSALVNAARIDRVSVRSQ